MVIPTVLTQASNLEEIIDLFDKKFVIINDTNPTLGLTPPLHFIFSDSSGQSLIIEPSARWTFNYKRFNWSDDK